MSIEPVSLSESVSSAYLELTSAAGALNVVSDALGKAVSDIDDGLKKLNLGVTAWVHIGMEGPGPDGPTYLVEELGYAKVNSKWGIALMTRFGDSNDPTEEESIEIWAFNDAPRALRLRAIEKIPNLVKKLSEEATKVTKELQAKLADAQAVARAINPEASVRKTLTEKVQSQGFAVAGARK